MSYNSCCRRTVWSVRLSRSCVVLVVKREASRGSLRFCIDALAYSFLALSPASVLGCRGTVCRSCLPLLIFFSHNTAVRTWCLFFYGWCRTGAGGGVQIKNTYIIYVRNINIDRQAGRVSCLGKGTFYFTHNTFFLRECL